MSRNSLTPRQDRFCREYIVDLNATAAAIRAGYSPQTAPSQGSQVLSLPKTQVRIAELQQARQARTQVDADFVLTRLVEECNADAGDLYDDAGRLKPVKEWPAPWRRGLVSSIRSTELFERGPDGKSVAVGVIKDVVLVDRARRLELLGKHIRVGAFSEKVTVGLDTPLQELFKQIAGNVIRPASERARLIEHEPEQDDGE